MKKLMLFFAILTLTNLNAQEKQNDATWEETIEFLRKNIQNLDWNNSSINVKYRVENDNIVRFVYRSLPRKEILNFNDIAKVSEDNLKRYILKSYGKYVKIIPSNNDPNYYRDEILLGYIDENNNGQQRVIKALNHLAYLANKKRSKSKF